jgi:hypothetical protein
MKAGQARRGPKIRRGLDLAHPWVDGSIRKAQSYRSPPAFRTAVLVTLPIKVVEHLKQLNSVFPKPYLIWSGNRNIAFEEWDLWTHSGSRLSSSLGRPSKSAPRLGGVSRNRGTSLYNLTTAKGDFQGPRTTRRSKARKKLYTQRKKKGQFQDI